ncbi:hypothetical protein ACH5RR_020396 [Cinchona calisaya]|uniref:Chromatin modification-related protein EAF1 B n=1 Tax=Cinchona calisaya TaxID=153742 RepID=A0ABD2ZHB6_9GENT
MHGCSPASAFLVNAEVDSMGGVVEGGVGVGTKTSPRRAAIEKVQAELRQEYDVREERRKELEFLEKGGNPLDFNFGKAASVSVQSTSQTDQQPELFVTSEAKGSFAFATSPHGDSVESSGRPGVNSTCEPNSADNLMLFDGENDSIEGDRVSAHPNRTNIASTEHSSQRNGNQSAKELGDSAAFGLPRKAYKRRTRPSRDSARSSSTDAVLARGSQGSSLPFRHGSREAKITVSDAENRKEQKASSNGDSKPTSPNGVKVCKSVSSEGQLDMELDSIKAVESTTNLIKSDAQDVVVSATASKDIQNDQCNPQSVFDARKSPAEVALEETGSCKGREEVISLACLPHVPVTQEQTEANSGKVNGFSSIKGDDKRVPNDGQCNSATLGTKVLDSESSCSQTSLSLDGNNDSEMCTDIRVIDSNGNVKEQTSVVEGKPTLEGGQMVEEMKAIKVDDSFTFTNAECNSAQRSHEENGFILKTQEEIIEGVSGLQSEMENQNENEVGNQRVESSELDSCNGLGSASERRIIVPFGDNPDSKNENGYSARPLGSTDPSIPKLPEAASPARVSIIASDGHTSFDINSMATKTDEDSILEEARIIEARRKKISDLSMATLPVENGRKSQWDFVLEEMSWLANDFAQERIWKITAAAQICHRVAYTSRLRFHEQNNFWEHKKIAHVLARAVMEFWQSVEDKKKVQELQCSRKDCSLALREYAVRFLKHSSCDVLHSQAEAPMTPDRISDLGITDNLWEDHLTEENLFYTVLPGAAETYRRSIVSSVVKYEKTGSSIQEEVETSACDAVADCGSQDNAYEEDEGETSTYDASAAFEGSKSLRSAQKKWKNSTKAYNSRTFEVVADSPYVQCMENKAVNQQPLVLGKRPATSLNVSFPTKRVRTSNRQRVLSPFQVTPKTDGSSGDTNSFQDDQSTLHGGSHLPNNMEVESVGDFEKQLPFDSTEISTKNKKKKKPKHLGSAYEHRWPVDSNFQNEQRDHSKKRSESHQLESNGSSGLLGQHISKKPKMMRLSLDNSFDSGAPIGGSAPSPVASQISNQNKLMKVFSNRDRGRKNKGLKIPASQSGSGSQWSLFEEQALVVLVHDLGPNWELVSDAINSTVQFKCVFRNPKECKERHKMLTDTGDGADSAEDSGSSQPYNSTLHGIPKGSARQLFQHLQGPMEEDTLRCHFEKIIMIGQKLHSRRKQNDVQDPKQLQPPHGSHMLALSQFCPNYLSGGSVLTPLDLGDATTPSSDILPLGYQGPHAAGLAISNQGTMTPSSVPGSSNMIIGSNFSSSPGPINTSVRDARYAVPRSASLSTEEQQRMQQYNQMFSGRNLSQSNLSSPGILPGNDRGVRMLPGGNAVGTNAGINRGMPVVRPGFQGIASSPMVNGSMISSGMVAVHPRVGSAQGNSTRSRDALHMMRPSQNQDSQRQMMGPELQMQVSQGNNQGIAPFGSLSPSFPNQTGSPPVSSYPLHHQQSHGTSPQQPHVINPHHPHLQGTNHAGSQQHQAYAIRLAKERHVLPQQRILQQQQQQFASSNSMMPHVQPQTQLPISSLPQNNSQIQSQTSSPPVSLSPLTSASSMTSLPQHQQKPQILPHGIARNVQAATSGHSNQVGKQRQRQPQQQQFQQAGRHHPQQRQQTQSQQQAKVLKGGRGNTMMHQNTPIDPSVLNGLSTNPANQSVEKGEQAMDFLPGQGLYSGSAINPVQSGKPLNHSSNQSQPQQKMYSDQSSPLAKHLQQIPSHSDTVGQGHVSPVASVPLSTGHQSVPPHVMASSSHQLSQAQANQKVVNQNQPSVQRVLQQNRHVNSDPSTKLQRRESQTEQQSTPNSSHMGVMSTMPQTSSDAANVSQVLSTGSTQWRASEPLYDSSTSSPAINLSSIGTPPTNSAGNEPSSQVGQPGLGQRQSSGNLPPVGQDISVHWQQQALQLQEPPSPVSQQQQSQQQLPPLQHSQQQTQLVGYVRSTESRLE